MDGYIKTIDGQLSIQSIIKVVLESSNIIENSNSPDTVIGRCQLLKSNVGYIRDCRDQAEFNIELQNAIDRFKQTYYDKIITQTQTILLVSANQEQFNQFFFTNIERSFYNYVDAQIEQINSLKRQTAIEARKLKLNNIVSSIGESIKSCFLLGTNGSYFERSDELLKSLKNYVEQKMGSIK